MQNQPRQPIEDVTDADEPAADLIPLGLRCWVERPQTQRPPSKAAVRRRRKRPHRLAVLDTECATEDTLAAPLTMRGFSADRWPPAAQALLFGRIHLYDRDEQGKWRKVEEYLFYPDDLPQSAIERLQRRFTRLTYRMGDWREPRDGPGVRCFALSLTSFLDVFYRRCVQTPCIICGFNLAFDLTRLASRVGPARTDRIRGGFSLELWPSPVGKKRNSYRPRLYVKMLDTAGALFGFSSVSYVTNGKIKHWSSASEFLDLQRLVYSLTGEPHSLASACRDVGIAETTQAIRTHGVISLKYLVYNREDVELTTALAFRLLNLFDAHPISRNSGGEIAEYQMFSTASLGKHYLDLMGVRPRLTVQPDFPRDILGAAMEAFYGARCETRYRNVPIPVVYTDTTAMYSTVAILLGVWRLWTADEVKVDDATVGARSLLDAVQRDDLLNAATWLGFNILALVEPHGDVLPIRGRFDPDSAEWTIGLGPVVRSPRPLWYALPDLIASKLRTGVAPRVIRAVRITASDDLQPGLRPIAFRGVVPFDPRRGDFFRLLVEERARVKAKLPPYDDLEQAEQNALEWGLKGSASSIAYGVTAEINRQTLPYRQVQTVTAWTGADSIAIDVRFPERAGRFSFPPIAALVTAGARLVLAVLESLVEERGGTFAFCDTDSMAIVARSESGTLTLADGSTVRVLSWADVAEIAATANRLNPYDRALVPSLVKIEDVNFEGADSNTQSQRKLWAAAVSPKRYALFVEHDPSDKSKRKLVDWKESALGGYLDPAHSWRKRWWQAWVAGEECPFGELPAIKKLSISSWDIYRRFNGFNRDKPYEAQIKPFNFCLSAREIGFADRKRTLLAPYDTHPAHWAEMEWIDYGTGEKCRISTDIDSGTWGRPRIQTTAVWVASWQDVWSRYWTHPVVECRGTDAQICQPTTVGRLVPRRVEPSSFCYLGKESYEIERAEADLPIEDPLIEYGTWRAGADDWVELMPILEDAKERVATELQISPRRIRDWLRGREGPSDELRREVVWACEAYCRDTLEAIGFTPTEHRPNLFATYRAIVPTFVEETKERVRELVSVHGIRDTASMLNIPWSSLHRRLHGKRGWSNLDVFDLELKFAVQGREVGRREQARMALRLVEVPAKLAVALTTYASSDVTPATDRLVQNSPVRASDPPWLGEVVEMVDDEFGDAR